MSPFAIYVMAGAIAIWVVLGGLILRYLYRRLCALDHKLNALLTRISPLWARVQTQVAKDLHHPHPRYLEMDTLLERLEQLVITDSERERLKALLSERATDMHEDITDKQRTEAMLMSIVMELVVLEAMVPAAPAAQETAQETLRKTRLHAGG